MNILRHPAFTLADDRIQERRDHRVFPDALLTEVGLHGNVAWNPALIHRKNNQIFGHQHPLDYPRHSVEKPEVTV